MRKPTVALIAIVSVGAVSVAAAASVWISLERAAASPEQPVRFPHRPHTEAQIDCSFCHPHFETQSAAGMPPTSLCASCHAGIESDDPDTPRIFEYAEQGKEIPWVRLYQLPPFTTFTHRWHAKAGIDCQTCHGNIGESDRAARAFEHRMAWCMDCHAEKQASNDCLTCHK